MIRNQTSWPLQNWIPALVGLLLRLVQLQVPIVGIHSWRQADTASMARHFAIEGTPIWLPQIDWGGASPGFVECEFPLFPYLLGQIYKIVGIHEWLGRGLSAILSALTIILIIRIGRYCFDPISGWWGGLFFAILPLNIYYGRTLQAESLLLLLSALSIERLINWKKTGSLLSLLTSWLMFCLGCLIKVLPLIWLGIPLLVLLSLNQDLTAQSPLKQFLEDLGKHLRSPWPWIYGSTALLIGAIWYLHAYQLGQESGFSFGFWGESSDRSSLRMLFNLQLWLNLFLRVVIRNLAIIGLPIMLLGVWKSRNQAGGQFLISGLFSIFICTAIALRASSIHEYYQLPIQLFACPLLGKGWLILTSAQGRNLFHSGVCIGSLALLFSISLVVLHIDYWGVERQQAKLWMPLAQLIRKTVPQNEKIVSITGSDPTLLNLARRQGWITTAKRVTRKNLQEWLNQGATKITGSLDWEEMHIALPNGESKDQLISILCKTKDTSTCINAPNRTYLISIKELIND